MRRLLPLFLFLCLFLTGCGAEPAPTVYEADGFTLDKAAQTITKGENVYHYEISPNSEVTITYPNGATYWRKYDQNGYVGGWSDDYDGVRYADGDTLMDLVSYQPPRRSRGSGPAGLLLLALGLFHLLSPRTAWFLSYGWRYRDAEPSDAALVFNRIGGVIALLVGVLLLFI